MWVKLLGSVRGQGVAEYAVLLILVAVVVGGILVIPGPQVGTFFGRITRKLPMDVSESGEGGGPPPDWYG